MKRREPTLKEKYAVSEIVNDAVAACSLAIEYLKVWRTLCAEEGKKRRYSYKLREARRELKAALALVRQEIRTMRKGKR